MREGLPDAPLSLAMGYKDRDLYLKPQWLCSGTGLSPSLLILSLSFSLSLSLSLSLCLSHFPLPSLTSTVCLSIQTHPGLLWLSAAIVVYLLANSKGIAHRQQLCSCINTKDGMHYIYRYQSFPSLVTASLPLSVRLSLCVLPSLSLSLSVYFLLGRYRNITHRV